MNKDNYDPNHANRKSNANQPQPVVNNN